MLNEKIFTDEKEKHYKTHCKKNFLGMKNMQIINIYHTPRKFERRKIISTYEIKFLNFNVKKINLQAHTQQKQVTFVMQNKGRNQAISTAALYSERQ